MKAFARSFFALGVLTALVLLVFPDVLKFVSIPADDSMLPKTAAGPASSTTTKETSEAQAAPTIVKRVELLVNGVNYQFQLASLDADYVYAQAKEFCLQHAASQSMSESALESGCTRVVLNNLIHKVNEKRAAEQQQAAANSNAQQEQRQGEAPQQAAAAAVARDPASTIFQINVPVTNGKTYAVSFDAAIHSPYDVSNHFCRENARELGLESEMHITQGCIPSVGKYVEDQLEAMGFVRPEGRAEVQQVQAQQQEIQQQEQQVQEVQQEVSGESSAETATANAPVATEQ